jgi:hypothetical protein
MSQLSENAIDLKIIKKVIDNPKKLNGLILKNDDPQVYMLVFPECSLAKDKNSLDDTLIEVNKWVRSVPNNSTICIIASSDDAATILPTIESECKYQLWVALRKKISSWADSTKLTNEHVALLVFTKYKGGLRHTKTRIPYTYCPACGKTTKDYGGKKHIYHEYGTLISDVWRDIKYDSQSSLSNIISRLKLLFGVQPYNSLNVIDLRTWKQNQYDSINDLSIVSERLENIVSPSKLDSILLNDDCLIALKKIPENSAS